MLFDVVRLLVTIVGRTAFLLFYAVAGGMTLADHADARGECGGFFSDPWWYCVAFGAAYCLVVVATVFVQHCRASDKRASLRRHMSTRGDWFDVLVLMLAASGVVVARRIRGDECTDGHDELMTLFRSAVYASVLDPVVQGVAHALHECCDCAPLAVNAQPARYWSAV